MRNAFLAMTTLADTDHWCWRIGCSTCLCGAFRLGLQELAAGRHPDSTEWTVHRRASSLGRPRALTFDEQVAVLSIVSEVDVDELARSCEHPAWLGYLGLVLHETVEAEEATGLLTRAVLPQLLNQVDDSFEREMLAENFIGGRRLRWQDLESFERPVCHRNQSLKAGILNGYY